MQEFFTLSLFSPFFFLRLGNLTLGLINERRRGKGASAGFDLLYTPRATSLAFIYASNFIYPSI